MTQSSSDEILATVGASAGRRVLAITALVTLGVLLVYVAFTGGPSFGWQVFLVAVGAGSLWLADLMRKATANVIHLTETELRDSDGTVIAQVEEIEGVDRGAFAFKPSNGFLLKTTAAGSRVWRPGLWWRVGRRVGVGGMTPGHQTKFMSEIIAVRLAERSGEF